MQAKSERFEMRLDPQTVEALDRWRRQQSDLPSRAEAARRLMELGLSGDLSLRQGEKLILMMLCEVHEHLRIRKDLDARFIQEAVWGDHLWALSRRYSGLLSTAGADQPSVVTEVSELLLMWRWLETSYRKLSKTDQKRVANEAQLSKDGVRFPGFDANEEGEHYGVANFMIHTLGDYEEFSKHYLNSHRPTLSTYRDMLRVFKSKMHQLRDGMAAAQMIEILNAPRS